MEQTDQDFKELNQTIDNVGAGCFFIVVGFIILALCLIFL